MRGRAPSRRTLRREEGQALVEFLVILPIFLAITFAVIEFGLGINYWIDLTHLSNEGARFAAVDRWPGCVEGGGCPKNLKTYLTERANTQELEDDMQINICFPEGTSQVGDAVRVTVTTEYDLGIVDGVMDLIGAEQIGTIDLGSSATMRIEQPPARVGPEVTACT